MARIPVEKSLVKFSLPPEFSYVKTDDPEFNQALDLILNTSYNLFINGPAGVGKSVLIELSYKLLPGATMIVGSTGISASHLADDGIPATTIHCGLRIKPQDIYSRKYNSKDKNERKGRDILTGVDTLLIEEVGMVSASLFDQIGKLVEKAQEKTKKPIRIICFGDVLQLAPVVKKEGVVKDYYEKVYDEKIFFFNSFFYKTHKFVPVFLNKIYRQAEGSFQNVLNRLRLDKPTSSDFATVNSRIISLEEFKEERPISLILAPTNSTVRYLNDTYGIPDESAEKFQYQAVAAGEFNWENAGLVEKNITIYKGQQVMCIHNETGSFQNGTLGIAVDVSKDSVSVQKSNGVIVTVKKHKWAQYDYYFNYHTGEVEAKEIGSVVQIGCKPATASTIHKAQGLTLESVYFDLRDRWVPASGIYLGLSRCKTLEGIGISRKIVPADIEVEEEPLDFLRRYLA